MMRFVFLAFLFVFVAGCSGTSKNMPSITQEELSDAALHDTMQRYFKTYDAPLFSHYLLYRTDMDSDGFKDAIVLMRRPHGYWCDTRGCKMFVLKATANGFVMNSVIEPVREPVYLTFNQAYGWRDIVVSVAGGADGVHDVILQHDGRSYPRNPILLPPRPEGSSMDLLRIFYNEGTGLEWDGTLNRKLRSKF